MKKMQRKIQLAPEHDPEKWKPVFRKDMLHQNARAQNRFRLKRFAL
jgi:hypothetical protein